LGKTHQIMALMTAISYRLAKRQHGLRFLVICPTTVLSHWMDKVMEFCPALNPHVYHGTDRSFEEAFQEHNMIITSYGIALRDIEMLADFRFDLLVLDEIQTVKNKTTKTYAAVKALDAVCTVGLTGTPIENTVMDLKSLFDIILPGYLMSDSAFDDQFSRLIDSEAHEPATRKLSRIIHPFTLRRTKGQVLKELPPKIEDIRHCQLSDDQISMYQDVVENQGRGLLQTLKDPGQNVPYMHVFAVLNYLKQICNHPCMLEGETKDYGKYSSGKWDLFVELLEESLGSGQKVVVFSQYVIMLELIESYLRDHGIEFATIKGHTTKRGENVKRFNTDPKCMVFSASLRASGLGIDLTGGSVVIHYDRWWNSAREEQATDRVHRIGQRRGVQVFKLITEKTLEEKIDKIISKKKQLMESVVKPDDMSLLKHFSREDLIELISF
jgi:SNF2 family DNA or RNA helicase